MHYSSDGEIHWYISIWWPFWTLLTIFLLINILFHPFFKLLIIILIICLRFFHLLDEVWSGLFVDQLAALLGNHSATSSRSSPTLLENYLLSALQLVAREQVLFQLPCGKETKLNSGSELQIELMSRDDKSIPFWELQMKMKRFDNNMVDRPCLLENEMFIFAKNVFDSKVIFGHFFFYKIPCCYSKFNADYTRN